MADEQAAFLAGYESALRAGRLGRGWFLVPLDRASAARRAWLRYVARKRKEAGNG